LCQFAKPFQEVFFAVGPEKFIGHFTEALEEFCYAFLLIARAAG
jgi:hypothetical protein